MLYALHIIIDIHTHGGALAGMHAWLNAMCCCACSEIVAVTWWLPPTAYLGAGGCNGRGAGGWVIRGSAGSRNR
jgi:hypothetical protein